MPEVDRRAENWDDFQISNLEILLALHSMDRLPRTGPRRTVGSGCRHPASSVLLLFGDRSDRTPPPPYSLAEDPSPVAPLAVEDSTTACDRSIDST